MGLKHWILPNNQFKTILFLGAKASSVGHMSHVNPKKFQYAISCIILSLLNIVYLVSGGCTDKFWRVSGRCLDGVWRVSLGYLEGVTKVLGRYLEGF